MFFGSWATNIYTGIAISLIWPCIALLMNSQRAMVIGAGLGLTILLWIIVIAVYLHIPEASAIHSSGNPSTIPDTLPSQRNASDENARSVRTPVATPDYIPGTIVTHADLRKALPFGYVVFSQHESITTHIPYPTDKLVWEADWSTIRIRPNFSDNTVEWGIERISGYMPHLGKSKAFHVEGIAWVVPLTLGTVFPVTKHRNQPELCFGTIGIDQRKPVFVLGFVIVP